MPNPNCIRHCPRRLSAWNELDIAIEREGLITGEFADIDTAERVLVSFDCPTGPTEQPSDGQSPFITKVLTRMGLHHPTYECAVQAARTD